MAKGIRKSVVRNTKQRTAVGIFLGKPVNSKPE